MPADKGVRLDDRQRIANFREQPIETNEYHSVDGAEGEFFGAVRRRTLICCRNVQISASSITRDRIRSTTIQPMSLQRSLIAHDHRPILDRLPSRIRFATGTAFLRPRDDRCIADRWTGAFCSRSRHDRSSLIARPLLPVTEQHMAAGGTQLWTIFLEASQNGKIALIHQLAAETLYIGCASPLLLVRPAVRKGAGRNRDTEQEKRHEEFVHHVYSFR